MDLLTTYRAVEKALNTIDFPALYNGFHPYRFALYNDKEICLDGKLMPYQKGFLGNTSILHKGEYIAIWSLAWNPQEDADILAYFLVHEMFHCHQNVNKEKRYPSDLDMVNCPEEADYYLQKYNENVHLAYAFEHGDKDAFLKFLAIRGQRKRLFPSAVAQELKTEGLEGLAEYVGLKALRQLNTEKYNAILAEYLHKLRAQDALLFDARRLAYYSGTLYFAALERFGRAIRNDFSQELTAYEQNEIDVSQVIVTLCPFDFIASALDAVRREKQETLHAHIGKSKYVECEASICGYDPMNMFRAGEFLFCKHFIFLKIGDHVENKTGAIALKMAKNSNQEIIGYYIPEEIQE